MYKRNEIVCKYLLAGEKFMSEMHFLVVVLKMRWFHTKIQSENCINQVLENLIKEKYNQTFIDNIWGYWSRRYVIDQQT